MTSYGDHQSYGQAHGTGSYDDYASDSYSGDSYAVDSYGADSYGADSYRPAARSSGGRASVSAAAAPAGRAPVGRATPGRASVPPPDAASGHRYDWGGAGGQRPGGRASVPAAAGGAASGRASVRPSSGGPRGPSGPTGSGDGGSDDGKPNRNKKRHWLRNSLLAALAVLIITIGGGMVALSYYIESVPPPENVQLEEASTVYYSNGKSEMATLQEVNREIIDTKVPELANIKNAVVAAEDSKFFEHSGVDFAGIMRAMFNNLTGGARQGASTIDQQYVGVAADLRGDSSYSRKMKEAAMAYRLNQDYEKEEILDFYLNTVYFGRGAYGVQAAAQAYFGKDAADLTVAEAALIAGTIKTPDLGDGSGLSPYDPLHNPDDPQVAIDRWNYVLGRMVEIGAVTEQERGETEFPEVIKPKAAQAWHKGPQSNIVRQVRRELTEMGIEDIDTGGYRIITTIDRDIQKAARASARRKNNDSPMWENIEEDVTAALTAVDPQTGRVLAYYGGEDGVGVDFAGKNYDDANERWEGGRAPGSTFKIYTLIAALREGVSLDSFWQTSEYDPGFGNPIHNAGRRAEDTGCDGHAPDYCSLSWSTVQSYNVPFFHYVQRSDQQGGTGAGGVVEAARDAGVTMMTDNAGNPHDLTTIERGTELARDPFDYHIAFGQYPITVLDHANGVATLAASGVYYRAHFVQSVEQRDPTTGEWREVASDQIKGEQRVEKPIADAITGVLSEVPAANNGALANGRPAAAKTGTWEHPDGGNRDAWVVGYTPQIAAAVWVGDPDAGQIKDVWGNNIGSSGLPFHIWTQFMNDAHAAKEWPSEAFPPAMPVGNPQHPYANGEMPVRQPDRDEDRRGRGDDDDNGTGFQFPFGGDGGEDPPDPDGTGEGNGGGNFFPDPTDPFAPPDDG